MEGYLHSLYAHSLSEFGEPIYLPQAKGWLIKRPIPGTSFYDAMGPYPLFFCENWEYLFDDINALSDSLVSVSLVVDPFAAQALRNINHPFDVFFPFKDHYILDTSLPILTSISKNKQRNTQRALKVLEVFVDIAPNIDLDRWVYLYNHLIERHQISGIRAFSPASFADQIEIPNTHCFWAMYNGQTVGGNLYYIQGDVAYAHLSAFSPEGYRLGAPYAVKWIAIRHLAKLVRYINFGGSPNEQNQNGLSAFKLGWSNETRKSYFCGKILDDKLYQKICMQSNHQETGWFPAYRDGESF